jgi:hypothetical protein
MRIDVTASSTPKNYPREICGEEPCVPLYSVGFSWTFPGVPSGGCVVSANTQCKDLFVSSAGTKDRYVIVDVGGETVVTDVVAPADKFDAFLPKAQKVLDSVEWKGR